MHKLTERRRLTVPLAGEFRGLVQREPLLQVLRFVLLGALLPRLLPFLQTYIITSFTHERVQLSNDET